MFDGTNLISMSMSLINEALIAISNTIKTTRLAKLRHISVYI